MINFKNKKILVTGASGGIGREIVKKFYSLEGKIVATGTNTEKLDLLKKDFPNINIIKFDISNHSKIEEFVDNATNQLTGLDILINNAGTNMDNLSLRMKEEEWKKVIDINLTSTFLLSKYSIKKMLKNKFGRIVNITLNCVSPGFIQSRMTDNIIESVKNVLTSRIQMSRLGNGEDVANSVAFLASYQASYITGETIHVNGGMYMA